MMEGCVAILRPFYDYSRFRCAGWHTLVGHADLAVVHRLQLWWLGWNSDSGQWGILAQGRSHEGLPGANKWGSFVEASDSG